MKRINEKGKILAFFTMIMILFLSFSFEAKTTVKKVSSGDAFAKAAAGLAKANKVKASLGAAAADEEFNTARLIVKTKGGSLDFSQYQAVSVIEGGDHTYLVQFGSVAAARDARAKLSKQSSVRYAESDRYSGATEEFGPVSEAFCARIQPELEAAYTEAAMSGETVSWSAFRRSGAAASAAGEKSAAKNKKSTWGAGVMKTSAFSQYVKSKSSRSVVVAVLDSGVSNHSQLKERLVNGYDFIDNDGDPKDSFGHGTHVAGIVKSCTPGLNVKIMPVRVLDENGGGCSSLVGVGIRYAVDHGASVINLSLRIKHSEFVEEAIKYALKKNVIVVAASGNDYSNTEWVCPAHMKNVIVVGAVDDKDRRAFFSNYGKSLDVTAPGVDIVSTSNKGGYVTMSGTSMACPHVSAEAAMYRLLYPKSKPAQIEKQIRKYIQDLGKPGWDKYYGCGRVVLKTPSAKKEKTVKPKSVVVVSINDVSVEEGTTLYFSAEVLPSNATNKTLRWSSSNTGVAKVEEGVVKCLKPGKATITVKTSNGKKDSKTILVTRKPNQDLVRGMVQIPFASYSSSQIHAKKFAVPLTMGNHTLLVTQGYVKFTAPKAKTYTFTFSNVKPLVEQGTTDDAIVGMALPITFRNGNAKAIEAKTEGGSYQYINIGSSRYVASRNNKKPYKVNDFLTSRTASLKMKKGQTIYLFIALINDSKPGDYNTARTTMMQVGIK